MVKLHRRIIKLGVVTALLFGVVIPAKAQITGGSPVNSSAQVSSGFGGGGSQLKGKPSSRMPGLKVGSARFHGGLDLEFGYDSNVFYSSGGDSDDDIGSIYLGFRPAITIGNSEDVDEKDFPKLLYDLMLGYSYKRYLQELSTRRDKDFHGANLGFLLQAFPKGTVSFDLHETFVRTSQPRYLPNNNNFDRDMNVAGAGLSYRPGGGLIDLRLGYRFVVDVFEASDLKHGNYYYHQPEFRAKWKFFPKTSFWLAATWQFISYFGSSEATDYTNNNSRPIRVMTGVTGQFTPTLSFNAGIGYGYSWYQGAAANQYNLPIAMADMTWTVTPTAKLTLGYQHDFRDSMWGDYFMMDTAYLNYHHQIINKVDISATFRWIMAQYSGATLPTGFIGPGCENVGDECDRTDNGIQVGLAVGYHITNWVSARLGYTLYGNFTDFYTLNTIDNVTNDADFVKHLAYLNVNFAY